MARTPAKKQKNDGLQQLKADLKSGTIGQLYVLGGEEDYLKQHYLKELSHAVVDETFWDFNYEEFEGAALTADQLGNAIDSYPAMAERRMVVVKDFDVYKPTQEWKDVLTEILGDLPEYICLVFYYDTMPFKPDKRTKIHTFLQKHGVIADFTNLSRYDLLPWIQRHAKAEGKTISDETCDYLLFLCGTSMTNLLTEIQKASAHSATEDIKRSDIDAVCSKVLDAVVFDLTDAIADRKFDRALQLIQDLVAQKNEPIVLLATIAKHIGRLYAAKLAGGNDSELMELLGTKSSYYARKMRDAASRLPLRWLRGAVLLCGDCDVQMKTAGADRQQVLELLLLQMAADFREERR